MSFLYIDLQVTFSSWKEMNKQENALQKKAKKKSFPLSKKQTKKINLTWLTYQPQKLTDRRQNISISEIQWISQGISYS